MVKSQANAGSPVKTRRRKESQFVMIFRRVLKDRAATISLCVIGFFVLVAIFAPLLAPYDPYELDKSAILSAPSWAHPFGTDQLGRDVLSRLIYGSRYSLTLGMLGSVISLVCACILGCLAGYFGGIVESIIMRCGDVMMSLPGTLLSIIISAALGPGYFTTLVALTVGGIFGPTRMLRGQILRERGQEYLEAAEAYHCSKSKIMFSHLLPNSISPLLLGFFMGISGTITSAAGLSFLGLGIQPPMAEWGAMLSDGRNYLRTAPYLIVFPGLVIMIFSWCMALFGDALRDALDPKMKT